MILVTRINNRAFVVNADLIETVEETPDTVITLSTGKKYVVLESVEEIVARVASFRQRCWPVVLETALRPDPGERADEAVPKSP